MGLVLSTGLIMQDPSPIRPFEKNSVWDLENATLSRTLNTTLPQNFSLFLNKIFSYF